MEQQALSDFSVTKCILAEGPATNSSTVAVAAGCCSEQLEKNVNNNNILPVEVKQDSTVSGKWLYQYGRPSLQLVVQYNSNIIGFLVTNNDNAHKDL